MVEQALACNGGFNLRVLRLTTPARGLKSPFQANARSTSGSDSATACWVESRLGASTDAKRHPRFPTPLIKPDVPISGIRLSDWFHRRSDSQTGRRSCWRRSGPRPPANPEPPPLTQIAFPTCRAHYHALKDALKRRMDRIRCSFGWRVARSRAGCFPVRAAYGYTSRYQILSKIIDSPCMPMKNPVESVRKAVGWLVVHVLFMRVV